MQLKHLHLVLFLSILFVGNAFAAPQIFWSSAKAGPASGWEGSGTKGAAITLWVRGANATRGTDTLTCCGDTLNAAGDFAEWGANTNPTTAKDFRRITFYLNSDMSGSDGIYITVDSENSNTIPFTIDPTGLIRFVASTGDNSDGTTLVKAWTDLNAAFDEMTPGDFIYISGTWNLGVYVGYKCRSDAPGTDDLRITATSYPGTQAVIGNGVDGARYIKINDNYWTITNLLFNTAYIGFGWGQDSCEAGLLNGGSVGFTPCPRIGNQAIGCEFIGDLDHAITTWGDETIVVANKITADAVDSTSYPLYLGEGNDCITADNDMQGGSDYVHLWDETGSRCGSTYGDVDRVIRRHIFERNFVLMNQTGGYNWRAGILIGCSTASDPGTQVEDAIIRNNVFANTDNNLSVMRSGVEIRSRVVGIDVYNNTVYNLVEGVATHQSGSGTSGVNVWNNLFSNISSFHVNNDFNLGSFVADNNFYDETPSYDNTSDANAVTAGDADFVSTTLGSEDFNLQISSGAIDVCDRITGNTYDFNKAVRLSGVDLDAAGAYIYGPGGEDTTPPELSISVIASNGIRITLSFDENVSQGTGYNDSDWDIDCSGVGNGITLNYVSGNGTPTHLYNLGTEVQSGEICNIDYVGDTMKDDSDNLLEAIISDPVTNNSAQGEGPPIVGTFSGSVLTGGVR